MFRYTLSQATFYSLLICGSIFLSVLLSTLLKNKSDNVKRIPLKVIAITIIVLEVVKQIYNSTGYDTMDLLSFFKGQKSSFSYWALPFHFCSLFSLVVLLSICTRGKVKEVFECVAYFCSTAIAFAMFFLPEPIWGSSINELMAGTIRYFSHTIIYHTLVFAYFAIETALHISKFKKANCWIGFLIFPIYASIGIPAARLLNQNYCSFLYPIGSENIFKFLTDLGPFWYSVIYVSAGTLVCGVSFALISLFRKAYDQMDEKILKIGFLSLAGLNFIIYIITLYNSTLSDYFIFIEMTGIFLIFSSNYIYRNFKKD